MLQIFFSSDAKVSQKILIQVCFEIVNLFVELFKMKDLLKKQVVDLFVNFTGL